MTVVHALPLGKSSATSASWASANERAADHPVHGHHAAGELAEPERGEAAAGDLGEHGEALLGLVVAREPDAEHLDRLVAAVGLGHQVGADLVVEQRLGPRLLDLGLRPDQQDVAGDHDAVDVGPDLGVHVEVGVLGAIARDLLLGQGQELLGVEGVAGRLGAGDAGQQPVGLCAATARRRRTARR